MELKQVREGIYLVLFKDQLAMTSTLLRFQEHYESPKYRGQIFSLEEFKAWYTEKTGGWTYYTDWGGFNFPCSVLEPFYEGKFPDLSEQEHQLLAMVSQLPKPFYLIAVPGQADIETLRHEIAHGLWTTNPDYRAEQVSLMEGHQLGPVIRSMLYGSYHTAVWLDECHAYLTTEYDRMRKDEAGESIERLRDISVAMAQVFDFYTQGEFSV